MATIYMDSPVGGIALAMGSDGRLRQIDFVAGGGAASGGDNPVAGQLREYFAGSRRDFDIVSYGSDGQPGGALVRFRDGALTEEVRYSDWLQAVARVR